MSSFSFIEGDSPLLISMPHTGINIPSAIASNMTPEALKLTDTDWFVDKLYAFAPALGASVIKPVYSRYVIDLNRGIDGINLYPGANSTELCPTTTFDLSAMYLNNQLPSTVDIACRVQNYWQPYHQKIEEVLATIKAKHGFAILLDAHSILSRVPRFFEGELPDFNFGTSEGKSCSLGLSEKIKAINYEPYSMVFNARFKGGYITRTYGAPDKNIHAIQLELSQRTYMNEGNLTYDDRLSDRVTPYLIRVVEELLQLNEHTLSA